MNDIGMRKSSGKKSMLKNAVRMMDEKIKTQLKSEQQKEYNEYEGIRISHQQGASVFSFHKEFKCSYDETKEKLVALINELSDWVDERDGIVGHIKAYITEKKRSAMLSAAGDTCSVKEYDSPVSSVEFTAIVFQVSDELFCKMLLDWLKEM